MSTELAGIPDDPKIRFIRHARVLEITGLTKSGLQNAIGRGEFPRPVLISTRHTAWVESEVRAWIARKIEQRNAGIVTEKRAALIEARRRGGLVSAAKRAAAQK
jgi:prophage regulatory protein